MIFNTRKPLFPMGEINDVAAVFAGTKPAAIIDVDNTNDMLQILIQMQHNYQVNYKIINNKAIFSKINTKEIEEIEDAVSSNDHYRLGVLLGYPRKAIKIFMQNLKQIKTARFEKQIKTKLFDKDYINKLSDPDFIPPPDWFE